jgi:pimeloyl-ACP methyl ester carboxylesterase
VPETVTSKDGTPIAVWRSGQGPPLVVVHGTVADHNRWAPALPALEEHFTVLLIDRRGRGASGDADDYAIEREYEDLVAVIESAGDEVSVLGHSYGGVCALEAALLTDRIAKLVVYEPPLGFLQAPREVVDQLDALLAEDRRDELVALFFEKVAGVPPDQIELLRSLPSWRPRLDAAPTVPREELANRGYRFDPDRFKDLETPTLFLLGGDSNEHFRAAAEATQAALPNCRLVELPGQTHTAMDTATDLFTDEVLGFLRG